MNKKLILWISAVIITFLAVFVHQRLSPYYPQSGSFGIEGEKVTYAFPKLHRGRDSLKIMIRTDLDDVSGNVLWKKKNEAEWNRHIFTDRGNFLTASIPYFEPGEKIFYKTQLFYNNKRYDVPQSNEVTLLFSGKRPSSVLYVFYFFLFGGLLIAVRGALEYFNPSDKRILFSALAAMFFFVAAIIFYPFIRSYELDVINKSIPSVELLFDIPLVLIFLVSFVTSLLVLKFKKKIFLLVSGVLVLLIYQFSSFYP
jgi:hypothetical protein